MTQYPNEINPQTINPLELIKKLETRKTPILVVYCPSCGEQLSDDEEAVSYDMEDVEVQCDCGFETADLWDCVFTLKGSGIYGIHGLFSNDPLCSLELEEAVRSFLFQRGGHGSSWSPFYSTNIDEVRRFWREQQAKRETSQPLYKPKWYRYEAR
jgi:hypothetical protein